MFRENGTTYPLTVFAFDAKQAEITFTIDESTCQQCIQ